MRPVVSGHHRDGGQLLLKPGHPTLQSLLLEDSLAALVHVADGPGLPQLDFVLAGSKQLGEDLDLLLGGLLGQGFGNGLVGHGCLRG